MTQLARSLLTVTWLGEGQAPADQVFRFGPQLALNYKLLLFFSIFLEFSPSPA